MPNLFRLNLVSQGVCVSLVITAMLGCDPIKPIQQCVVFSVATTGAQDVTGARISIRQLVEPTEFDKKSEIVNPGRFDQLYPWSDEASVDSQGNAKVVLLQTSIVDTRDPRPPPSVFSVVGQKFYVKVVTPTDSEILELTLNVGSAVSGNRYRVDVISVSQPAFASSN